MNVVTRSKAKTLGLPRYFTGSPCKRGHVSERYTKSGMCLQCGAEHSRSYRVGNPGEVAAGKRRYLLENAEKVSASNRASKLKNQDANRARRLVRDAENAEFVHARARSYYHKNRDRLLEYARRYRAERQHVRTALQAKRKARQLRAVPIWSGELDDFVWLEAADLVRLRRVATGVEWAADHMVPLACKTVSGLHVWNNCQVIPWAMNQSKRNNLILTEPGEWIGHLPQSGVAR